MAKCLKYGEPQWGKAALFWTDSKSKWGTTPEPKRIWVVFWTFFWTNPVMGATGFV